MNQEKMTGYPSIDKPWLKYYSKDAINTPLPKAGLYEYIRIQNEGHGEDIAIRYFDREITYSTMFHEIDKIAKSFSALGVSPGDVVSFIAITTPEIIYSIYALNKIGAVCNMLDPRMSDSTINSLVERADSKYMVLLDMFTNKIKSCEEKSNLKIILLSMDELSTLENRANLVTTEYTNDNTGSSPLRWDKFVRLGMGQTSTITFPYKENWPSLIEYTGGTTGEPKGVVLSSDNINSLAEQYKRSGIDLSRGHSWQTVSAPFIAYAFVFRMHFPLSYGMVCKIIIYDPKTIAADTVNNEYNHIAANPLVWETIIHLPEAQNRDFSHLIAPITGADYMSIKLEKEINEFLFNHGCKWKLCQGYGLTEVASGICVDISNERNRVGSVGIPFVATSVSSFDTDTGEELPYDSVGEICISGPSIMLGYLKNEAATNEIIRRHKDGSIWLHSGDLGHIDKDGFIFIDGRIKRMLVRYNGAKVFPPIIEKVIAECNAIQKCVVVGWHDSKNAGGQVPIAFIVVKKEYQDKKIEIEQELTRLCQEGLPDYAQPEQYLFVDSFPITPVGKVDYRALEKTLENY